jgi:hypothetical protein
MSFFKLINEESRARSPFNILVGCRTNNPISYSVRSFDQLKSVTVPRADTLAVDMLLARKVCIPNGGIEDTDIRRAAGARMTPIGAALHRTCNVTTTMFGRKSH